MQRGIKLTRNQALGCTIILVGLLYKGLFVCCLFPFFVSVRAVLLRLAGHGELFGDT